MTASQQLRTLASLITDMEGITADQRDAIMVAATLAVRTAIDTMRDAMIERASIELAEVPVTFDRQ